MFFLEKEITVTKIILACRVIAGTGETIHNNRPSHGLALVLNHQEQAYRFSDGEEIKCTFGSFIYLPKNSSYTVDVCNVKASDFSKFYNVTHCINFLIDDEINLKPFKLDVKEINEFANLYDSAEKVWKNKGIGCEEIVRSILYKIIANLKIIASKKYAASKQIKLLEPALTYITDNYYSKKIQIPELAEMCNISETYFRQLFLKEFGTSAAVYIRNKRLNLAKELLDSGEYTVTDVSYMSGFNDSSYFSREFKEKFGKSPLTQKNSTEF